MSFFSNRSRSSPVRARRAVRRLAIVLVSPLVVSLLAPPGALGHHSIFGRFDGGSIVELDGEVTGVVWRNPHVSFSMTSDAGETWEIETTSLSNLRKWSIPPDFIEVGDRIRIAGNPSVQGINEIYARHVRRPNDEEVVLAAGIEPRWSDRAVEVSLPTEGDPSRPDLGIFRVWSSSGPMLFPETVDPNFDMTSYPLTESARAVLAAFDRVADSPIANCAPKGMPAIMEQPYPMQIDERDGNVVLLMEEYDTVRTIHMDADAVAGGQAPSPLGYSRGRRDAGDLVVTTSGVNWGHFDTIGIPLTDAAEMVERFTLSADGSRLDYTLTVTDPNTFTEPVALEKYWLWFPEVTVSPYDCVVR